MSLLMQALKKAERAKQNSGQDSELEKPSEAFDEILALAPQEPATPAPVPPAPSFSLDSLSLSPLDDAPAAPGPAPAPEPAPAPATLALSAESLPPIPAMSVATEAIHDPVPPQARHAEAPAEPPAPAPASASARVKAELKAEMQAADAAAKADGGDKAAPRGAAARARAAAAAAAPAAERAGMDPAKLRIAVLSGIVLLIVLGYGYYFWQATSGPGSGGRLPMVPMPPPNATGATSALVVVPGAPAASSGAAAADATPAAPLSAQEKTRRERQQEHDQMYAQLMNQIQAQLNQQRPQSAPETLAPAVAQDSGDIRVARSTVAAQVPPALSSAYRALGNGDLAGAQQQYEAMLQQDPNNRDALLGAAAVAQRERQDERAAASYQRMLELDPGDADALAGLAGLRQGDPNQTELRLKNALKRNADSGPVLFALGNLYARQGRWPEAQQTYFRAYSAVPGNADYAFNLAIGLDRLNQPKLAVTYYQRALALAQDQQASFDRAALRKRLQELGAAAQP